MLRITVPDVELYDSVNNKFYNIKGQTLQLEHSLVSLSKWESKWHKPFLSKKDMTYEETLDYIKCMTITQNVNPMIYNAITDEHIRQINEYIEDPMTATCFYQETKKGSLNGEIVTSELIYYWMTALNIPSEYQKWHLNRLITLIRVCNIKNQPAKKRNPMDIMRNYAAMNEARKKKFNSKG